MNKVKLFQISLNRGEVTQLPAGTGQLLFLECRQGSAWLTVPRDPEDYIVDREHPMQLVGTRKDVLVQSMTEHLEIDVYQCA